MNPNLKSFGLMAAVLSIFLTGCGRSEIQVYRVPKEIRTAPAFPQASESQIAWATPQGWNEQPSSGMRLGSFAVPGPAGKAGADVSIVQLTGEAGGTLANINRWRSQLELGAISETQMARQVTQFSVNGIQATMVDLLSSKPVGDPPQVTRMLAVMIPQDASTVFVKMTGEEHMVTSQKAKFLQLVSSIRFSKTAPPPAIAAQWKAPPHWKAQPLTAMRKGSFLITGENNSRAEVSITSFGGMAGGILANINRWRGQIGLAAISEPDLEKNAETTHIQGHHITIVNMAGKGGQRILGAITPHGEETWFFKISGDDQLVQSQKPALIEFLKTVKFP